MRAVLDFFAHLTQKVGRSKSGSPVKIAKLHHCPVCHEDHY